MSESLSSQTTEPGRVARNAIQANQTGWKHWLPGWNTLRAYESSWLRHDLVAGLAMTTMLVPVGIAYAEASGVPGINGLYGDHRVAAGTLARTSPASAAHRLTSRCDRLGHRTFGSAKCYNPPIWRSA